MFDPQMEDAIDPGLPIIDSHHHSTPQEHVNEQ